MTTFLICGYGIPKDIRHDQHYVTYLNLVFNHIYGLCAEQEATIIPCGGPTNCTPPFEGTEAAVIAGYMHELMQRDFVRHQTSRWSTYLEDTSLSSLENLLFARDIIQQENLSGPIIIFCEKTREKRLLAFATHLFPNTAISIHSIDFDMSSNRYLDPSVIQRKEDLSINEGLWTLEDPERRRRHHALFEKKIAFLRKRQSEGISHVEAVQEWLRNESTIVRTLMPDHPLFKDL